MRTNGRAANQLRDITLDTNVNAWAEGSCLACFGRTQVLCTASVQEQIPSWMRQQGKSGGWITAEYGMLPRATELRVDREAVKGKQSGRTQEISRLIGRAARAVVDLQGLGNRTIWLDCDVLQADGGTRTAAVTGSFVALSLAIKKLIAAKKIMSNPVREVVAAVSAGVIDGNSAVLDLDYHEDSNAIADGNFVITESGKLVEVQATAEKTALDPGKFEEMFALARTGIVELIGHQKKAIGA